MDARATTPIVRRRAPVESAAAAGIVYSVLTVISLVMIRRLPDHVTESSWSAWIDEASNRRTLVLGLALGSIAAVAFLWFVAVVRRRVGDREDQFFATVFLGSALVYVALWLVAISVVGALALAHRSDAGAVGASVGAARYADGLSSALLFVAAPRIQAVFVASTSTIFLRTRIVPNWLAYLGYVMALVMFIAPIVATPLGLGLPVFVFVSSLVIFFIADVQSTESVA
jgi:hypothetical protein